MDELGGYKTTERDREMIALGIRAGIEAAAGWHHQRSAENTVNADDTKNGMLVRTNCRVWAEEHSKMASAIRSLSPDDILRSMK